MTKNERQDDTPEAVAASDALVFDVLAKAQLEYDAYLQAIESLALLSSVEDETQPASPDLPLSLTIWQEN